MKNTAFKKIRPGLAVAIFAILVGAGLVWQGFESRSARNVSIIAPAAGNDAQNTNIAGIKLGGDFTLINHDGQTVTAADYNDSYKLVFFGFTSCPDICPAGLEKIKMALTALGEQASQITPLFITVDPERDTPAIMKDYVGLFDDRIIGLTGSPEQIEYAMAQYKIYASKTPQEKASDDHNAHSGHNKDSAASDHSAHNKHDQHDAHDQHPQPAYDINHSAFIYLMGPENNLQNIFRADDSAQDIAAALRQTLQTQ